jgi:protein-S-isoprenylcysteine O-methyltransferase Ste14
MMVRLGNFFFRFRTTISPLLLLLLFLPGPAVLSDPFVAAIGGLVVAFLGQVVRAATIGLEYIVRGGRNHRVYAEHLVTEGLFKHSRNPLYVGKFFMVLGLGIASNRWPALLAICGAYSFMYQAVVLAEEAYLREKFGAAFEEYCDRTPRWWPRLAGISATFSGFEFNWKRVLTKEYSAPLGWVLPIVLIGLYNLSNEPGSSRHPYDSATLLSLLAVVGVFWLTAGLLKKRGTLFKHESGSQV